ncbi:Fic family protein [Dasania marina]|uniref:Fic family protein n=1 Tax=Dasania marina TaxID=471499 RepID=UPI0030D81099|tara:strand:+ start:66448 stop:67599 length:1152 start_codon:yes stop_codon:yes gene_type:complete
MSPQKKPPEWIWQQSSWPNMHWDSHALAASLREVTQLQGSLLGKAGVIAEESSAKSNLDALLQNIVQSSAIEGEVVNAESVRSSLAKRLGVEEAGLSAETKKTEGLAELLLDATQNYAEPLTLQRLLQWHCYLFPEKDESEFQLESVKVGQLRGDEPMQVVSGPHHKRTVHFQAPARVGLETQLNTFLTWLAESEQDQSLDPILRAAQAHFWFVTLHPFDDGNGRLARAISDYALAQAEHQAIRFYAMAASIMENRNGYYAILEATQKGDCDITAWMQWFLETFKHTLQAALTRIDFVLLKTRYWQTHAQKGLNPQQVKVLNRLLDAGPEGFEGKLNAKKYMGIAGVAKATATRHLQELLEKKCITKLDGGGRSTRYDINWPK